MAVTTGRHEQLRRSVHERVQRETQSVDTGGYSPLLSRRTLQIALGALWLLDGALQIFPSMWTSHLSDDVMQPVLSGQPVPVSAALKPGITLASQHIILTNALIMVVQLALGVALLAGFRVRATLFASILWSAIVWTGGEGLGMLLTGQAGAFTGAPGAVLLYGLLGLAALPSTKEGEGISTRYVQKGLALLWGLCAVLQLQPYWWQPGQLSDTISANQQPGTLSGAVLDGSIGWAAGVFGHAEITVNVCFIAIALLIAIGIFVAGPAMTRWLLVLSMIVSLAMWWATQGFGLILTGGSTDVNAAPLVILTALACWPRAERRVQQTESQGLHAQSI